MEIHEPSAATYGSAYIQSLRKNLNASIALTDSEEKLERCLEVLHEDSMPCVYSDEEFAEVVKQSEESGNASEEKVKAFFAKWGH